MDLKRFAVAAATLASACGSSETVERPPTALEAACGAYCQAITAACTGANAQFDAPSGAAECSAACLSAYGWPLVDPNGAADDLACRTTHANLAAAGPAVHCRHAGPTGGGVCGSTCAVYCDLQVRNCSPANPAYPAATAPNFADRAACMTACAAAAFATTGTVGATGGDSFQCRVWHLGKAAAGPATHCPHTRVISVLGTGAAGPCTGPVL